MLLLLIPLVWAAAHGSWRIQSAVIAAHHQQRAVDRAAYSGAASITNALNRIAMHNQAMIGAHLLQGHLVSQLAWTQYVMKLVQGGGVALSVALPGVGTALAEGAKRAYQLQKLQMPAWTLAMGTAGKAHQALAWSEVLKLTASLDATIKASSNNLVTSWSLDPHSVSQIRSVSQGSSVLGKALEGREWLTDRSWSSRLLWVLKMEKKGASSSQQGQWYASDELSMKIRGFFKWKRITLAKGAASSRDYGYLGAASLIGLDRDAIWLLTRTQREHAVGWVKATRTASHRGILLWPVWEAQLGALPYLKGWSG